MGADMLIYTLAWKDSVKLDWAAGARWLDELTIEQLNAAVREPTCGFDLEEAVKDAVGAVEVDGPAADWQSAVIEVRKQLHALLRDLKDRFDNNYRDVATLAFGEWRLLVTGGMSWGDVPSDTAELIDDLTSDWWPLGDQLLEAVGFGWPVTDQPHSNAVKLRLSEG